MYAAEAALLDILKKEKKKKTHLTSLFLMPTCENVINLANKTWLACER